MSRFFCVLWVGEKCDLRALLMQRHVELRRLGNQLPVLGKANSLCKFGNISLQFDRAMFRKVKEIGDKFCLQDDIDKLVKWSEKWQMLFNFGKCKYLHTGSGNTGMNYEMGGTILSKTVNEKDLGVTMNANMKVSEQCRIKYPLVRPTLEYASAVCDLYTQHKMSH